MDEIPAGLLLRKSKSGDFDSRSLFLSPQMHITMQATGVRKARSMAKARNRMMMPDGTAPGNQLFTAGSR